MSDIGSGARQRVKSSAKQVLVYKYGLLAPTKNADLVHQQIELARQYYNKLVEIERARREEWTAIIGSMDADVERLMMERSQVTEKIEVARSRIREAKQQSAPKLADVVAQIKEWRTRRKALVVQLKEARSRAKHDPIIQARVADSMTRFIDAKKQARTYLRAQGLYRGAYALVDEDAAHWRSAKGIPQFRRRTGEGRIGMQIAGGIDAEALASDTRVRVGVIPSENFATRSGRRNNCRTTLSLRVGSNDDRSPIWAEFPMIMHRPLPAGAVIKWVTVITKRVGSTWRWDVCFTLDATACKTHKARASSGRTVAIDVGWRTTPQGMRIAVSYDGEQSREYILPKNKRGFDSLDRRAHADSIQGIRDKLFNDIRERVMEWKKNRDMHVLAANPRLDDCAQTADWKRGSDLPEALTERLQHIHAWKSPRRLVAVARIWATARVPGDETIYALVQDWMKQDRHLWDWTTHEINRALGHRREVYRTWAAEIVRDYDTIVMEDMDLRAFAKSAEPEEEAQGTKRSRQNRHAVALSEFRTELLQQAKRQDVRIIAVNPAYTTRTCSHCGAIVNTADPEALIWTCDSCGIAWDQDENAAMNILRVGRLDHAPSMIDTNFPTVSPGA